MSPFTVELEDILGIWWVYTITPRNVNHPALDAESRAEKEHSRHARPKLSGEYVIISPRKPSSKPRSTNVTL